MKIKLQKLESIRGFASIYVVLHHLLPHVELLGFDLTWLFKFGQEAVILFFLLSGFVIELSFSNSKDQTFKTYFLKRFLRIYIPWFLVLITQVLFIPWAILHSFDWNTLVGNFFMLQDLPDLKPNVIVAPIYGNSPMWSLSYEWWFYMLYFPLNKYVKTKSSLIVGILGVSSGLTYVIYPNFFNRELMYLTIWWLGIAAARLYVQGKPLSILSLKFELLPVLIISFILMLFTISNTTDVHWGTHPLLELAHFIFSLIVISAALLWRKFNWIGFYWVFAGFTWIAPISYEVYITHYILICRANYLSQFMLGPLFTYLVYFVICLCISLLIHRIFKYLNGICLTYLKSI
jgi:peptidoglycan/LPS O-acetylase OafA/YrhL